MSGLQRAYSQPLTTNSFSLCTHTPCTQISPPSPESLSSAYTVHTPRGKILTPHVVHATNAYASHLLPHLRGPAGIIPTRGQIIALLAAASAQEITRTGWGGNEGFEYWFPRPNHDASAHERENQLVIVGGGREAKRDGKYEFYETDDSVVDAEVGEVLRRFLPSVFPGKFDSDTNEKSVEMEWVRANVFLPFYVPHTDVLQTGIMGYTKSREPFVGPVIDPSAEHKDTYKGQYISAGYTGHGMPRAYAW